MPTLRPARQYGCQLRDLPHVVDRGLRAADGCDAHSHMQRREVMTNRSMFVGMDVHKESIDGSIAEEGRSGEVRHYGVISGHLEAVADVVRALRAPNRRSRFICHGGGSRERLRFVARLLEGEKMAPLCAEIGISRKTGYKIFDRYKDCGVAAFTDRSR
jgi:Helix-turn-helix domain